MKYRKKPVVVEAVQLTWANWNAICAFVPKPWFQGGCYVKSDDVPSDSFTLDARLGLRLKTLESQEFLAVEDDWIIKGVEGEFYSCKSDIFDATYEPVEE